MTGRNNKTNPETKKINRCITKWLSISDILALRCWINLKTVLAVIAYSSNQYISCAYAKSREALGE